MRGAPGLVLGQKGPEGGERFGVVILDPGGRRAACAGSEGPGRRIAAGREREALGAWEGQGTRRPGLGPGSGMAGWGAKRSSRLESRETVSWGGGAPGLRWGEGERYSEAWEGVAP